MRKDLTGQRFGRLVALASLERRDVWGNIYWSCVCDCGTIHETTYGRLLSGTIKSCGCFHSEKARETGRKKVIDLTGKTFHNLTVLHRSNNINNNRNVIWTCMCICGNRCDVEAYNLKAGHTKSCGCLLEKVYLRLEPGKAGFNRALYRYKNQAKKRGLDFLLTEDQFGVLTKLPCHYCGIDAQQISRSSATTGLTAVGRKRGSYIYNGIDRINNNIGYIIDNCVPCCIICNRAKSDMGYDNFISWIDQLTSNWERKKHEISTVIFTPF